MLIQAEWKVSGTGVDIAATNSNVLLIWCDHFVDRRSGDQLCGISVMAGLLEVFRPKREPWRPPVL